MISREMCISIISEIVKGQSFRSTEEMAEYIINTCYLLGVIAEEYALDMEVAYVQKLIDNAQ